MHLEAHIEPILVKLVRNYTISMQKTRLTHN